MPLTKSKYQALFSRQFLIQVLYRAGSKVAAFIQTDVTKYKDNQALFKLAESEFGGVDVCIEYIE